jgi:NAD(P)H-hydrate repair Nnr-like enzyme with NAD(P)H-hydrate dehydratase domain
MKNTIYIDQRKILKRYKQPIKHTHKGIQGHALIIGGSYGKIGQSLSSKACLKTGCGLVTVLFKMWVHYSANPIPEVMVLTDIQDR